MAEAFGLASNVVQFVVFATKVCIQIHEISSSASGMPKKLQEVGNRVNLVLKTLEKLDDTGRESLDHKKETIESCRKLAEQLSTLLESISRKATKNSKEWSLYLRNALLAWKCMRCKKEIREFEQNLEILLTLAIFQVQLRTAAAIGNGQNEKKAVDSEKEAIESAGVPASLEATWKPTVLLPFDRNPAFVGREETLVELDQLFDLKGHRRVALYGLGGVGKSQIASEFAIRYNKKFPDCSILWVHAETRARFKEGYQRIALECSIPGSDDQTRDHMQLVKEWLTMKYKHPWLLIIDNVDDRSAFFEEKSTTRKSLLEYLPQGINGSILYTTRNKEIGVDLSAKAIKVEPMELSEAQQLLKEKIGPSYGKESARRLFEELEFLPLAISQAAAFMQKKNQTVEKYLDLYQQSDDYKLDLLGHEFVTDEKKPRAFESVMTTWLISFEQIKRENPKAADLLILMSFLDRQGIPKSLLPVEDLGQVQFIDAIGTLESYSLLIPMHENRSYDIHRLVQLATRTWINSFGLEEAEERAFQALLVLCRKFPLPKDNNTVKTCELYLPHAQSVLQYQYKLPLGKYQTARAELIYLVSHYFCSVGLYHTALSRAKESYELFRLYLGSLHTDTLSNARLIAHCRIKMVTGSCLKDD